MKASDRILIATAIAAFVWVVVRAATQAITIDEATTYSIYVGRLEPFHWFPASNNHVLNTALIRFFTTIFGVSEFTVRIPALLGAALYITACVRFCRRIGGEWWLQWLALACLVGSPFILDYLVAARGYALALGFLMTLMLCDFRSLRGCAWASAFGALCLASNFSFALAATAAGAGMVLRSLRETTIPRWKLLTAYLVPGLAVTWLISSPAILNFPRAELWYGAHSLRETFASIVQSQTFETQFAQKAQPYLFPALALVSSAWLAWNWQKWPSLTRQFGATFLLTIALHIIAFHATGLLYPMDRTAIFLVPLGLGAIFATASIPGTPWLRYAQIAVLGLLLLNNILCLRRGYFEEWSWDQDTDRVYAKLACLHDREQVTRVASGWHYIESLRFYRDMALSRSRFDPVVDERQAPADTEVFVLWEGVPLVTKERSLTRIWRAKASPTVIAVPQEQVNRLQVSTCLSQ